MAFSAEQLAALEAAAASGELRVQIGDNVIQYQTLTELMAVIRMARADQVAATSANTGPLRYTVGSFPNG
jgi:hypothetical protein